MPGRFGNFKTVYNPFSTKALTRGSDLPIDKAFVGRNLEKEESHQLLNFIRNPGGGCCLVEGDIGVGKTTLVNYHRYLWEYKGEDKLLSPLREISVYGRWEAKDLLMEILGHLSNKLLFLLEGKTSGDFKSKRKKVNKSNLLKKIRFLHEVFYQESADVEGSLFGFGFGYSKNTQLSIPNITESQLISYLMDIVSEIKKLGYKGVFLHFDNLELLSRQDIEKCKFLFEEIRDIMQLPDIYYVFVAQKGFFSQVIAPSERVRSIMSWPISVPPLTSREVVKAIEVRYEILAVEKEEAIKPLSDKFIEKLYQLYSGKIRFVMDTATKIILNFLERTPRLISNKEAEKILLKITQLKTSNLTHKENQVLKVMVELKEFSNEELSTRLEMQRPNISKIIKQFLDYNLIYLFKQQGRKLHYRTIEDLKILSETFPVSSVKRSSTRKEDRHEKLISYLQQNRQITRPLYEKLVEVATATAYRDLSELTKQEKLEKRGKGKSTVYVLRLGEEEKKLFKK